MRRSWLAVLMVLSAVGCAGPAPRPPATLQAVPVKVRPVELRTLVEVLSVSGSVQAESRVDVSSKIPGRVVEVLGQEGSAVRRGQVLVRLDASDAQAQLQQAEAALAAARARVPQASLAVELAEQTAREQLRQAEAGLAAARSQLEAAEAQVAATASARAVAELDLQRFQQLFSQGAIASQQLDAARSAAEAARAQHEAAQAQRQAAQQQLRIAEASLRLAQAAARQTAIRQRDVQQAQAAVQQAEAAVRLARLQLQYTEIRAPLDGVVLERRVEPGEFASPGVPLLVLADLSTVWVHLVVSETQVERVHLGQRVRITVDALPEQEIRGQVEAISPAGDPRTRTFLVKVRIPNRQRLLKPGMFARGEVVLRSRQAVPAVPTEALVYEGARAFVYVVASERARRHPVTVGLTANGWAEVAGLAPGTLVVVAGQSFLRDGDRVTVER